MSRYKGKREDEYDRVVRRRQAKRLRGGVSKKKIGKKGWFIALGVVAAVVVVVLIVHGLVVKEPIIEPQRGEDGIQVDEIGPRKGNIYTFLLVGTDKGGGNTDTIMLATYDTDNQSLSVMSIPRDTMVNLPWDIKKINSVYAQSGIDGLKEQIKGIVGYVPDFYVEIDLEAFVVLVDEIGGVTFNVPQDMYYNDPFQDLYIDLKAGEQVLNGEKAMELVRFRRYASGDIGRIDVQQDFMKALIKQCLAIQNWTKISSYINIFNEYVESDLSLGEMLWIGEKMMGLDMDQVNFMTLPGNYGAYAWSRTYRQNMSYVTIKADEAVEMINTYFNPYDVEITLDMLDIMSVNADGTLSSTSGTVQDTKANQNLSGYTPPANNGDDKDVPVLDDPGTVDTPDPGVTEDPGTGGTPNPGVTEDPGTGGTPNPGVTEDPGTGNVPDPGVPETPDDGGTSDPGAGEAPDTGEAPGPTTTDAPDTDEPAPQSEEPAPLAE